MKYSYIYTLLLCSLLLSGCSQDDLDSVNVTKSNELLKNNKIKRIESIINDFRSKIHSADTRVSFYNPVITEIQSETYYTQDSVFNSSRSSDCRRSYEIHTVSVDFGESKGYAILSDTPGLDRILFYTESGSISDTVGNIPLRNMVKSYPAVAADILSRDGLSESLALEEVNIQPLVRFEWDQGVPFNSYGEYCNCSKCSLHGNHRPIGCVAVALAQAIATMGKFRGTFYGTKDIDFSAFPNRGSQFKSPYALQVGHFLQEIALNCQMKYDCSGSGTSVKAAYNYLRDLGYDCQFLEWFLDRPRFIANLKLGLPHLVAGHEVNGGGHMWILDGCISDGSDYKFHMNWGWGYNSSNGWTTSSYFKDERSSSNYSQDHQHIYFGGTASFYPFE